MMTKGGVGMDRIFDMLTILQALEYLIARLEHPTRTR